MNRVQHLYLHRKSLSTKPFAARGWRVVRCQQCMVAKDYCVCAYKQSSTSDVGVVLLMHDGEILKPSNTGRLIADVIPNTFAYIWRRNQPNDELLALIADEQWQPMVVFPKEYAEVNQTVYDQKIPNNSTKKPLFILLDGSWREARRMFRKSPYLHNIPLVSFGDNDNALEKSRYKLREASKNSHLATAEVAAKTLQMAGENIAAEHLDLWFDVFVYQYQQSVCQTNHGNQQALATYQAFLTQHNDK